VRATFRRRLLGALAGTAAVTALAMGLVAAALTLYHMGVANRQLAAPAAEQHLLGILARSFVIAAAVGGLLAALLAVVLSRRLAGPLERIRAAATRIAAGDYDQRIAANGADREIRALAGDFNRMAAGLAETEALRRELVANVSHELRTPLTSVIGYLDAIEDGVEPQADALRLLRAEAERLRQIVDDLSALSRAESAGHQAQAGPIDIGEIAALTVDRFAARAREQGVNLGVDVAGSPAVHGDPALVGQVLDNLVDNALRYTPPGGRIGVRAREEHHLRSTSDDGAGDTVVVSVEDTGVGMSAEDLQHVFERFYRADRSRSRGSGGTGIGLAIVKHLVERQGGEVWVVSQPGSGSRFSFRLPAGRGEKAFDALSEAR
jgi:two-component system sensor histidine kinase BaeS